ncbi:proton/glutamate symport protein [Lachnospiraceae bacterium KM106-2]|nr:proton/glutamate symport protein [Lachnospiraceae bacterium KM106-2]
MKKKIGLTSWVLISLLAGAIFGIVLHYLVPAGFVRDTVFVNGILYVVGKGFVRAMQMLVVPLVLCSLVCGTLAIDDTKQLGKVGIKTVLFYMTSTALAVVVALGIANLINPGRGLDMSNIQKVETTVGEADSFADVLLNIIPTNPFESIANGNMLQLIFFAVFLGCILAKLGSKTKGIANLFREGNEVCMAMTMTVMKVAPIGVFCLISSTFASTGWDAMLPLFKYTFAVYLALAIQCFGIYMLFLRGFTKLNPMHFIKKYMPVMGFAFSTAASNATIPLAIETLNKKIGVSKRISSFTIPLGATINMDGTSIMQGVAVVFVAQAFNINLSVSDYVTVIATATLASVGTAGVPGVGLITLSMVLNSVGLPLEGIGLIMGIDRIIDMARTTVNITGDAVCTTIVANQEGGLNKDVFIADNAKIDLKDLPSCDDLV